MEPTAVQVFLDEVGEARSSALRATTLELVERKLEEARARASACWPGVQLEPGRFARALAGGLRTDVPQLSDLDALHAEEVYLAAACAVADRPALLHFERVYMSGVRPAIARIFHDLDAQEEVAQRLRTKLFVATPDRAPKIAEYRGHGALAAWLRVAALREALDLRRQRSGDVDDGLGALAGDEIARAGEEHVRDPELALLRARYGADLRRILNEVIASLPADDRAILRLHYADGIEMELLGRMLGVHRSTISRRLANIREAVSTATRARIRETMRASTSEVESILRWADSSLDLSLHEVFGGAVPRGDPG
jgi:RNA polymerase sigma-70 factor (ECF subfamily)